MARANADVAIRKVGRAGHITLTRPQALNALSHEMCSEIDAALIDWAGDGEVDVVVLDGEGERAFCAGGDVTAVVLAARQGDYSLGRDFWREEYVMNARLANYHKPVVSFLHGFVLGGGVGLGAHVSHRVAGESVQISMPECGIGLIPDVGGTFRLARAPGRSGEYLGLTGARIGPSDAIWAGFADLHIPEGEWHALRGELARTGDAQVVAEAAIPLPPGDLAGLEPQLDRLFAAPDMAGIVAALEHDPGEFAAGALKTIRRNSPLSMAMTLAMVRGPEAAESIERALVQEFRATWRLVEVGDFQEGVRAQLIDKDRSPKWADASPAAVTAQTVDELLAPLGDDELRLD